MKKIYFLLFCFLFTGNVFAGNSNIVKLREIQIFLSKFKGEKLEAKKLEARIYFEGFRKKITDKLIDDVVYARKRDKQNGNTLLVCSAIYYCSDNEIREMLEEDLGKDDLSIGIAEYVSDEINI